MSFDRLAPHYRWLETVLAGPRLQRCRLAHLDHLSGCREVLLAGEGHGRFLAELLRRHPDLRVVHLDASAGMQRAARLGLARAGLPTGHVEFVTADVRRWTPPAARFGAVVTHFFLDCFGPEDLPGVVARLATAARSDARWLLADFRIPPHGWRRRRAQLIVAAMYACFRLATRLPAHGLCLPEPELQRHGFHRESRAESEWGLLCTEVWRRPGLPGNRA